MEKEKRFNLRVPRGSRYYYIDSLVQIKQTVNGDSKVDETRLETGNYFQTKEYAEEALCRVKSVLFGLKYERGINV